MKNESAFPVTWVTLTNSRETIQVNPGMTMRQFYKTAAMKAWIVVLANRPGSYNDHDVNAEAARLAVEQADTMLAEDAEFDAHSAGKEG